MCEKYSEVPTLEEDASFYTDFGAKNRLSLIDWNAMFGGCLICWTWIKMMKKLRKALADAPEDAVDMVSKVLFHAARMLWLREGWMRKLMIRRTSILKAFHYHWVG